MTRFGAPVLVGRKSLYDEGMAEPKKPKPKDTRTQQQRFEDFAREHGATEDVLDKALKDVAKPKEKRDG